MTLRCQIFGPFADASTNSREHAAAQFRQTWSWQQLRPPISNLLHADREHLLPPSRRHVGQITTHFTFVGDPGQPTGARQNGQTMALRAMRNRGCAVVGQHDVVASQRPVRIRHPHRRLLQRLHVLLTRIRLGRLERVASFVGEFAKVDFMRMAGATQHADVRPSTEHFVFGRLHYHNFNFRVLKTHTLNDVGQLDINTQDRRS